MHQFLEVKSFKRVPERQELTRVLGVVGAKDGTLTIMVGGNKESYALAEPILALMGKKVIHCGDLGAGLAAKIANKLRTPDIGRFFD